MILLECFVIGGSFTGRVSNSWQVNVGVTYDYYGMNIMVHR